MAFNRKGWKALFLNSEGNSVWYYDTDADSLATVVASGYFNTVFDAVRQHDIVFVSASDTAGSRRVSSATGATTVTVTTLG